MLTYWVPELSNFKDFSGYLSCSILIFANSASYAYKRVSASLWLRLTFLELKISNILKSTGWGLEKNELPWNYQPTKFQWSALQTGQKSSIYILYIKLSWVCDVISNLIFYILPRELMQIFANGKRLLHSFVEYVMHRKKQGEKFDYSSTLNSLVPCLWSTGLASDIPS